VVDIHDLIHKHRVGGLPGAWTFLILYPDVNLLRVGTRHGL